MEDDVKGPQDYTSLRRDILKLAEEENALRLKLIELQGQRTKNITMLVNLAEKFLMRSVEELDQLNAKDRQAPRKVKYTDTPSDSDEPLVSSSLAGVAEGGKAKRACSICRKPGHRATTCPQADKVRKARKS